jgi:hypothetical protein
MAGMQKPLGGEVLLDPDRPKDDETVTEMESSGPNNKKTAAAI